MAHAVLYEAGESAATRFALSKGASPSFSNPGLDKELEDSTGLWIVLGLGPGKGSEAILAKDLPLPPAAIPRVFLVGAAPNGWENPPLFTFFGTVSNPPDITLLVLFPGDSALKTSAKTLS